MDKQINELTLLLLYLTSWEEEVGSMKAHRSWKGYPFEILNELTNEGLISGTNRSKSVYLTEDGLNKAIELGKEYLKIACDGTNEHSKTSLPAVE